MLSRVSSSQSQPAILSSSNRVNASLSSSLPLKPVPLRSLSVAPYTGDMCVIHKRRHRTWNQERCRTVHSGVIHSVHALDTCIILSLFRDRIVGPGSPEKRVARSGCCMRRKTHVGSCAPRSKYLGHKASCFKFLVTAQNGACTPQEGELWGSTLG
jgi:hypothetical protein